MRRSERAVEDLSDRLEILRQCKILRIALQDSQGLYLVPLNFGYILNGEKIQFYIHSAREGRKVAAMSRGCPVAFELDCRFQLQKADNPCNYSCQYASLLGTGFASAVEDPAEKVLGLSAIMRQQTGQEFSFTEAESERVAVFRIDVEQITGKQHV